MKKKDNNGIKTALYTETTKSSTTMTYKKFLVLTTGISIFETSYKIQKPVRILLP